MAGLTVSVVMATRNRPQAVAMSLPLLLGQTRPPVEIVIVDSSDDHAAVAGAVERAAAGAGVPVRLMRSAPGSSHQRNVGVAAVTGDVILFPDDDSLLFPDTLEELMRVYALDTGGCLAGVMCSASLRSPLAMAEEAAFEPDRPGLLRRIAGEIDRSWVRMPTRVLDDVLVRQARLPEALERAGCEPLASQFGFLMSFRADAIRAQPFNETLGDYAFCEDRDACFAMFGPRLFARAPKALIHHHRFPGARGEPYAFGRMLVMNQVYIVVRHTRPGHPARRSIGPWLAVQSVKGLGWLLARGGRGRFLGTMAGVAGALRLLRASPAELDGLYVRQMRRSPARATGGTSATPMR